MAEITVLKGFRDLTEHVSRKAGDTFTASDERAEEIANALPGYIEWESSDGDAPDEDLSKLTVRQLRAMASERGVELPKNANKQKIIQIIEG